MLIMSHERKVYLEAITSLPLKEIIGEGKRET
jgi:hypothetical protein